jgi:hypothetical protein
MQNKTFWFYVFFLILIVLIILGCGITTVPTVKATDIKVGYQIQDDGHVTETNIIPSDANKIYMEFFLDVPAESKVTLEFRWYFENQLIYSYSGQHERGYAIATLERDLAQTLRFPTGKYTVEIWFLNTTLSSSSFSIR